MSGKLDLIYYTVLFQILKIGKKQMKQPKKQKTKTKSLCIGKIL